MKRLRVVAAGLGWGAVERAGRKRMAGLDFEPAQGVFPAVTCVAQATLRTGLPPEEHGIVSNGIWMEGLVKPFFWEQSAKFVKGPRVWDALRGAGGTVGLFFFQQSLGESADVIVSPAPIHRHGGGMIMSCYTKPSGMSQILERLAGRFPLWRYWGPLASPAVGRRCIDWFERMTEAHDVDEAYLYLPTLDYAAQKRGPGSAADRASMKELERQLERLADICQRRGCEMSVEGDYDIAPVTAEPAAPNVVLRRAGLFRTREVAGMAYPDFYQSAAFAMCDHEFCVIYGDERERAAETLAASGLLERAEESPVGAPVLLAKEGSWCDYRWWTDPREAPDWASHVDIHNKPGFDPRELFFFCRGRVMGTHGRRRPVAIAGTSR